MIIVLGFVTLLTVLVLAFLSRSISNGLISQSSSNGARTDLYAHGVVDQVIGDLRQEIAAGSTVSASGAKGSVASPYAFTNSSTGVVSYSYRPSSPAAAVPYNAGPATYTTTTWNTTFPNLVKESTRGVAFYPASYDANAPTRAAAVNSTTDFSSNGRYVSFDRWNKHLLLPKASTTSTATTPDTSFVAPDWILTAVDGSNPTSFSPAITTRSSSSNVVGRYAYAIYNEGGLLDANVAGFPTSLTPAQQTLVSKKGPAAFADLTVLPGIAQSSSPQNVVTALVGWRNTATVQSTGTLPNYTLGNVSNYLQYLLGLSTRFMTVGSDSAANASDNAFTSRQQLIAFMNNLANGNSADQANLQNAMMYLGTFSRSLNQPSYWPDPTRPLIVAGAVVTAAPTPPTYTNGNSAFGADDKFNPPFKSILVQTSFVRPSGAANNAPNVNPDGTTAVVGEPLVKKRFALSRLAWLTPSGPIADDNGNLNPTGDPTTAKIITYLESPSVGMSASFLKEGGPTNIQNYFGLKWTSGFYGQFSFIRPTPGNISTTPIHYWAYSGHGANASGNLIGWLSDAQAAGREPDFFELLQASVNAGSIARAYTGQGGGGFGTIPNLVYMWDSQVAFQIFQLGANIIDQANPTQFPTIIEVDNGPTPTGLPAPNVSPYRFFGSQDLPYLNSTHSVSFIVNPVGPGMASPGSPVSPPVVLTTSNEGEGVLLIVPSIWNPYDVNSSSPLAGAAPTNLRITALAGSPLDATHTGNFTVEPLYTPSSGPAIPDPPTYPTSNPWISDAAASLSFSNVSSLYREPTVLLQPGLPIGSNLQAPSGQYAAKQPGSYLSSVFPSGLQENGSHTSFCGFLVGTFPLQFNPPSPLSTYAVNSIEQFKSPNGYTLRLEYESPPGSNIWVPYQEYFETSVTQSDYFPFTEDGTSSSPYLISPSGSSLWDWHGQSNGIPSQPTTVNGQSSDYTWDPRTARWGMPDDLRSSATPLDSTGTLIPTIQPDANPGPGATAGGEPHPPIFSGSSTPLLFSTISQNIDSGTQIYYPDADGVVRRAMGAYATSTVGLPLATVQGNPTNASNRPLFLHRPYRSVAELGYVFSDTPWKNIDFFTPESGYSALLDTFCINEDYRPDALSAGQVDLNTKQAPVIQALLNGAYRDEATATTNITGLSNAEAAAVAQDLVTRTTVGGTPGSAATATGPQPLANIADLVGRWIPTSSKNSPINGAKAYDGFSADLGPLYSAAAAPGKASQIVQRFRETTMRALSDAGQVGTWNLLIDVVAQTGRYPVGATGLPDFLVEGERHYWVHVAIDRSTGEVIAENVEVVNE